MKKLILSISLLAGIFVLVACTPTTAPGNEPNALPPEETGVEESNVAEHAAAEVKATPIPDFPVLDEATPGTLDPNDLMVQGYAEEYGVSAEEAIVRLELEDEIGMLGTTLEANEADTFAGLWIQHEPEYRVVVAFSKDAEETIRPYIEGQPYEQYVEVFTHRYTQMELQAAEQEALAMAAEFVPQFDVDPVGPNLILIEVSIDEIKNRVALGVVNPDQFLAAIQAAGRELPEPVELHDTDPENLMELRGEVETITGPEGQTIYFPKQAPRGIQMGVGYNGTLTLDENGCLRAGTEGSKGPVVIWGYDFELRVTAEVVEVLNEGGEVVGRVGEPIDVGGEEVATVELPGASLEACPGPYWVLHGILPLEAQGPPDDVYP